MIGHRAVHDRFGDLARDSLGLPRTEFIDIHCHCLPNLDDGPESVTEALALCRALATHHVSTVVATPHQLGRFEGRTSACLIRKTTDWLNRRLAEEGVNLAVLPGAEVRLDERIAEMLERHEVLTLADARHYLLLELPWDVFIDIEPLLTEFSSTGIEVILAHPERNAVLLQHLNVLRWWLECGVSLQITGASLAGAYGAQAQQAAWGLLTEGLVSIVATDAHDCQGGSGMDEAFEMIAASLGDDLATLLCTDNPARIVAGETLVSAASPRRGEAW